MYLYNQVQQKDYEKACDEKFDSTEKIIIFAFRLFVMIIAIVSSLFVIISIMKSPKKKFWPFKFLLIQVISELIDLTLALIFTVNSPCYYQLCIYVGYIMHSNWLASLEMLCLQCFTYFCMLKIEYIFHIIRNNQNKILVIIYFLPYIFLSFILPDGFGPSGWFLQDGQFYYLFCGFIQPNTLLFFWIIPVSILFLLDIVFSATVQIDWNILCYQRELAFSAKRMKSMIWLPTIYFFAWIVNFIVRSFDPPPNQSDNESKKKSLFVYILYQIVNLGFELHLLVGAVCFYIIYNGFLNIDDIWKKLLKFERKKTETLQSFHELSYNDD